ncbi:hypothetical protein [Chitinophaga varians]|uniref:hypothetical protein n=1 Tax=Chitinophaga varians TaxID=2202339 RepID=UPI00165F104B|nr:hypothetical protein [Chitinophaga varians]MBC9909092.1 hypothetical protein [Chitinophaga varians]
MVKLELKSTLLDVESLLSRNQLKNVVGGGTADCYPGMGTFFDGPNGCGTDTVIYVDEFGGCNVAHDNKPVTEGPCGWA